MYVNREMAKMNGQHYATKLKSHDFVIQPVLNKTVSNSIKEDERQIDTQSIESVQKTEDTSSRNPTKVQEPKKKKRVKK
jgi:hypothetical protein